MEQQISRINCKQLRHIMKDLKHYRAEFGLTQEYIAQHTQLTLTQVVALESNVIQLNPEYVAEYAHGLGIFVDPTIVLAPLNGS